MPCSGVVARCTTPRANSASPRGNAVTSRSTASGWPLSAGSGAEGTSRRAPGVCRHPRPCPARHAGAARQDLPGVLPPPGDWCDGRISTLPGAHPLPLLHLQGVGQRSRAMAPASITARSCSARLGALRCTGPGLCRARSRPSRSPKTVALSSRSPRRPMGGMAPARARTCQRDRFLRRDRRRAETLGAGSFASHRTVRSWRLPASTAHPRRR